MIADKIKELRLENGFSQKQIAEKLGVFYQTYQKWEYNTQIPKETDLVKLSRVFNVSISYLLGETQVKKSTKLLNISEKLSEENEKRVIEFAQDKLKEQENTKNQLKDYVQEHLTSESPKSLNLEFAQKLRLLLAKNDLSQANLARLMDVSRQTINYYVSGKIQPTQEHLEQLSIIFDVPVNELLDKANESNKNKLNRTFNKLKPHRQEKVVRFSKAQLAEQEKKSDEIVSLESVEPKFEYKVLHQALSAGTGEAYTDELDYDLVLAKHEFPHGQAVWIKGDSMEPTFMDGDVALIKEQPCIDYDGQVCALDDVEKGQSYIKCVYLEKEGYRLHSINQTLDEEGKLKYPDFILPFEANPRIIGKLVGHFTPGDGRGSCALLD